MTSGQWHMPTRSDSDRGDVWAGELLGPTVHTLQRQPVVMQVRTRSELPKVTLAIPAASVPWTDSSVICARRRVTTDLDERRTIRNNRFPPCSRSSAPASLLWNPPPPNGHAMRLIRVRHREPRVVDLQGQPCRMLHNQVPGTPRVDYAHLYGATGTAIG
jgi:hypothetical protein